MKNLRNSIFFDMEIETEKSYNLNDDLYKLIFDFCTFEDLSQISLCSSKFYKIAKELDYKYRSAFEDSFCSSYSNYE